jgi:hypothetical protein
MDKANHLRGSGALRLTSAAKAEIFKMIEMQG